MIVLKVRSQFADFVEMSLVWRRGPTPNHIDDGAGRHAADRDLSQSMQLTSQLDNPIRILIVDDDEIVATSLSRCCDGPGMSVVEMVDNAESALRVAQEHQPDVVLMDHRLDGTDGVEVAERLLAISPDSRVLIVTGAASALLIRAAAEAGCFGVIEKTMSVATLLPEVIRRVHAGEMVESRLA